MKLVVLVLMLFVSAAVAAAQSATPTQRPLEIVVFSVNPDVHGFNDKDIDLAMKNMVEGLVDTDLFSSIVLVRDKGGLSAPPGLVLEGVVTKYEQSNAMKFMSFGVVPTTTTLRMTFKLTDKASGDVLMQKQFTSKGTKKNGFPAGDWSAASTQMAVIVKRKVKKALKR